MTPEEIRRRPMKFADRIALIASGPDECWLWPWKLSNGYGYIKIGGKTMNAHRAAYELLVGPVPDDLVVDHLCRVRNCVNPAHLEPVTARENVLRGASFAAKNATKTHCQNGHELTPGNTRIDRHGHRKCRACMLERTREWRQRPGSKDALREYNQRPEDREKKMEYARRPEAIAKHTERSRVRLQDPDVKARRAQQARERRIAARTQERSP